jgi:hypothetical protein
MLIIWVGSSTVSERAKITITHKIFNVC